MKEKIIEILDKLQDYVVDIGMGDNVTLIIGGEGINEVADEIFTLVAKRDELIKAQDELIKIYREQSTYSGEFSETELRQKIEQLKKEL